MFTLEFSENLICAEALLGSEVQGSQLVASKSKESHLSCRDFMCVNGLYGQNLPFCPISESIKVLARKKSE